MGTEQNKSNYISIKYLDESHFVIINIYYAISRDLFFYFCF